MAELGRAYIEVRADLAKFPAELRAKLVAALKSALQGVEFKELGDKAEEAGEEAAQRAGRGFSKRSKTSLRSAGEEGGRSMLSGLTDIFRREKDRGGGGGLFGSISNLFSGAAENGLKGFGEKLSSLGQAVGQISNLGGPLTLIAQIAALAILGPALVGLAGALFQLSAALLALPAAAGVALAVIAPLMIAFQGFGEAVGAGLSGDVEKFTQALKGLAPSARAVVKEFVAFGPVFKAIKNDVQQAFFAPLVGGVKTFLSKTLPIFRSGLTQIGSALGFLGAELLRVFSTPDALGTFQLLLTTALHVVQRLEPALTRLFEGLLRTIGPALPYVEKFVFFLLDGLGSIGDWLGKISGDGRLTEWFAKAERVGRALWDVIVGFGEYLTTLLGGFGDDGADFLEGLAEGIQNLQKWLKTDEGQQFMEDFSTAIKAAGTVLLWLISLVPYLLRYVSFMISVLREVDDVLASVGSWFASVGSAIWDFLKGAGSAIADFFTKTIPDAFNAAIEWISSLPGRLVDAGAELGSSLKTWLVEAIRGAVDGFFEQIGRVIGLVLAFPQIFMNGLSALPGALRDLWDTAWAWAYERITANWAKITEFIMGIPAWLAETGHAIIDTVSETWTSVVDSVWSTVTSGYNRVMNFLYELPQRVRELGPKLYQAALSLGRSIGDGLASIGNFASDIGRRIVNTVKGGINSIIRSINSGIGDIDDALPGVSLPRIPMLAKGAIVDSPTLAVVGEAGREVVLPLNDPARARQLAEESNLFDVLGRGGAGQPIVNLTAILDGFGVLRVVDMRINDALDAQGAELAHGART